VCGYGPRTISVAKRSRWGRTVPIWHSRIHSPGRIQSNGRSVYRGDKPAAKPLAPYAFRVVPRERPPKVEQTKARSAQTGKRARASAFDGAARRHWPKGDRADGRNTPSRLPGVGRTGNGIWFQRAPWLVESRFRTLVHHSIYPAKSDDSEMATPAIHSFLRKSSAPVTLSVALRSRVLCAPRRTASCTARSITSRIPQHADAFAPVQWRVRGRTSGSSLWSADWGCRLFVATWTAQRSTSMPSRRPFSEDDTMSRTRSFGDTDKRRYSRR
jgi:hypothetical protein